MKDGSCFGLAITTRVHYTTTSLAARVLRAQYLLRECPAIYVFTLCDIADQSGLRRHRWYISISHLQRIILFVLTFSHSLMSS
jgi:hypothetical protein